MNGYRSNARRLKMGKRKRIHKSDHTAVADNDPRFTMQSGSGITIGDKTLEEWIDEEEERESLAQANEVIHLGTSKRDHYRKQKSRRPTKKQRNGVVRKWSQYEINIRDKENLMQKVESTTEAIMLKFISSEDHLTVAELTNYARTACQKPDLTRSSLASVMTTLKRSDVGYFIEGDNDPDGKGYLYWFVPEARNMTFEQVRAVYRKNNPDGLDNVVKSIPALEKYIARGNKWLTHDSRSPALKAATKARTEKAKEDKPNDSADTTPEDVIASKLSSSHLSKAIERSIKEALGINVSVNGKIDIVFSFKIG